MTVGTAYYHQPVAHFWGALFTLSGQPGAFDNLSAVRVFWSATETPDSVAKALSFANKRRYGL